MSISTGIPRRRAYGHLVRIISARAEAVTVTSVTETTNALDEIEKQTSEHTEQMWLTDASEGRASELVGEYATGNLVGLAAADGAVSASVGDTVTYGGVEYEITSIVGKPVDGEVGGSSDTEFWMFEFERNQ
jgi:hypothetical protein